MKKIIFAFLFLFLISSQIYAEEDLNSNVNIENPVVCTMDVKECPDGSFVSRDPTNNCEFFPCLVLEESNNNICKEKLDQLKTEIAEIKTKLQKIEEINNSFRNQERNYNKAYESYMVCLKKAERLKNNVNATNNLRSAGITGNLILSSKLASRTASLDSPILKEDYSISAEDELTIDNLGDKLKEMDSETIVLEEIPEELRSVKDSCVNEKNRLDTEIKNLDKIKQEILIFKEQHKEDITQLSLLIEKRDALIKECTGQNISSICEVPNSLLDEENRLRKQIELLKSENLVQSDREKTKDLETLITEHAFVLKKIEQIKNNCNTQKEISIQSIENKDCAERKKMLDVLDRLNIQIQNTTDKKEIYLLEEKIKYYKNKIELIDCDSNNTNEQNNQNLEEKLRQRIQELEKEKLELKNRVENQRIEIENLKQDFAKKTDLEKTDVIYENASTLSGHTKNILENRILNLRKLLEKISFSDQNEKEINDLQTQIAKLEKIKDSLDLAITAEQLKETIIIAREEDINARLYSNLKILSKNTEKLDEITEKYLKESTKYSEIKNNISLLKEDINKINENELSKEKIDELLLRYQNIKKSLEDIK